eukprot:1140264-Pyramimonas_sp.AAC.1
MSPLPLQSNTGGINTLLATLLSHDYHNHSLHGASKKGSGGGQEGVRRGSGGGHQPASAITTRLTLVRVTCTAI